MYKNILIPVALDHEGVAARKIETARALLAPGGTITLVTVLENVPGFVSEFVTIKSENHITTAVNEKLASIIGDAADMSKEVLLGKPGVMINRHARDNGVDLIIVGSHQPGIEDYFLGSTAARIARRAPCSVMIVR